MSEYNPENRIEIASQAGDDTADPRPEWRSPTVMKIDLARTLGSGSIPD